MAAVSLIAFLHGVAAAMKEKTSLPTTSTITIASDRDDQARIDEMNRGHADVIFTLMNSVDTLNKLVYLGWDVLFLCRHEWAGKRQASLEDSMMLLVDHIRTFHARVRVVLLPDLERSRAILYTASWCTYMNAVLLRECLRTNIRDPGLRISRTPLTIIDTVPDNSFVRHLLAARRKSIVVSTDRIERYSVSDWRFTLDGLWAAMHRFGLTPSAGSLLMSLVHRYAMWLDDDPRKPMSDAEKARVFDHWTHCRPVITDKGKDDEDDDADLLVGPRTDDMIMGAEPGRLLVDDDLPINPLLKFTFIVHNEKVLHFAMRHHDAFRAHLEHPKARAIVLDATWRRDAVKALHAFVKLVLVNEKIKTEAIEPVKNLVVRRYLMPGEAEIALFASGSVIGTEIDVESVLFDVRRDEFNRVQKEILPHDIHVYFDQWIASITSDSVAMPFTTLWNDGEWDAIAAARPITERAAFLVFETLFDCVLKILRVPAGICSLRSFDFADDNGLIPPFDVPPMSPDTSCKALTKNPKGTPIFVCLAQSYFVVVPELKRSHRTQCVYATPHLTDALFTWMAMCARRGSIAPTAEFLKVLAPCIQAPILATQLV